MEGTSSLRNMYELRKKNNIFAFGPSSRDRGLKTALEFETRELNVSFSPLASLVTFS